MIVFSGFKQYKSRLTSLALFTGLLCPNAVNAETYIVGLQNFDYYPHYNFTSDRDKGFIWAVLELYSEKSGHRFIYETMPVPRLQIELTKGTIDLIYPDNPIFHPNVDENQQKIYSHNIVETLSGAIIKQNKLSMDIEDVKTVSLPYGFTPLDWGGREKNGDIDFVETRDSLSALQLVEQQKTDAAEVDYFVTMHLSEANPTIGRFVLSPTLPTNIVGFKLATTKRAALLKDIDNFIRSNQSLVSDLKEHYNIEDPEQVLINISAELSRQPGLQAKSTD